MLTSTYCRFESRYRFGRLKFKFIEVGHGELELNNKCSTGSCGSRTSTNVELTFSILNWSNISYAFSLHEVYIFNESLAKS